MRESARQMLFTSLIVGFASLSVRSVSGDVPLVLNELMASNGSTVKDPQGQYDDWIEIYNGSGAPFDAAGLYLSDDPAVPTRWRIPLNNKTATTVPAGGFLLIWADGETTAGGLHADFKLDADGDAVYLFDTDGSTPIDGVEFGGQIPDVSYGRHPDSTGDWDLLIVPTPGMSNAPPAAGVVSDLGFSHERGFYEAPFDVTIECSTPDAVIYYTLDGSEPYLAAARAPTGIPYTKPVRITRTTCLRAIAVKPDWVPSRMETQTYLFLANVAAQTAQPSGFPTKWGGLTADYEMNRSILSNPQYGGQLESALLSLPSMSIVMSIRDLFDSQTGIYTNSGSEGLERPGSIELIYPDGTEGFQANCGVRIQGAYFRQPSACRKHSFRLLFKGMYGPTKLRYPLFGQDAAEEFETVVLRAGANDGYTWSGNETNAQFTRDQFMRDLQLGTGNAGPHGRFVHLYVNGLYWGLYNPCERPDAAFSASYYGGEKEDWDAFKHKNFTVSQGDRTALNQMLSLCQEAGKSYETLMQLQGRDLDGSPRPDYPCLLDLANYVDYLIVNMWGGNWDWPWNNYWLARDRTPASTGFKFYCWDAEDVMLTSRSALNFNKMNDNFGSEVGQPHSRLKESPEYRLFFADRVHRLFFNRGTLTPDSLVERYTQMAGAIEKSIIAEAARWGDQHGRNVTPAHWTSMRNTILTSYLPQRTNIVLGQFRSAGLYPTVDAPVFYVNGVPQHGGHAPLANSLAMQAGGAIYYTLDGSDPRVPGVEASAIGTSTTLVAENAAKRVLVPTGPVSNAWRGDEAFDESAWLSGNGGVGFETSTGYEPYFTIDLVQQMYARQTTCYLRIPFMMDKDPATLDAVQLRVRYDDGFIAYLNGVEVARRNFTGESAWNSAASTQNSDIDAINLEDITLPGARNHLRIGQNILAIQAMNQSSTSSDFLLSVMLVSSSTNAIQYTGPITLNKSTRIKARAFSGTVWSALNEAVYAVGPVAESLRISEIMYHPAEDPNAEYIELTNAGPEVINLNMVRFTKGIDYTFPSFELPPGGYCLLVKDIAAFGGEYVGWVLDPRVDPIAASPETWVENPPYGLPIVGPYVGSLSNAGERIELLDAVGGIVQSFEYEDDWFDSTDGLGFSLMAIDSQGGADQDNWTPGLPSPGGTNP